MHVITHACSTTEGLTLPPTEMLGLRGEGWKGEVKSMGEFWRRRPSPEARPTEPGLPPPPCSVLFAPHACCIRGARREVGALTQKRGEQNTEAGVLVLPSQCWLEVLASPYLCKIHGMRLTAWEEHALNKQTPGSHQDTRLHSLYLPRRGCVLTERRHRPKAMQTLWNTQIVQIWKAHGRRCSLSL